MISVTRDPELKRALTETRELKLAWLISHAPPCRVFISFEFFVAFLHFLALAHAPMPAKSTGPDGNEVGTGPRYTKALIQTTLTAALSIQPWRKPMKQRNTHGWNLVSQRVNEAHHVDPPLDQKFVHEKVDVMIDLRKVCIRVMNSSH